MSWKDLSRAVALAAVGAVLLAAQASAMTLVPPKPDVFLGVSDRGTSAEFNEFAALTGKHPALLQTFHPWGNSLNTAYERWRETGTRPVLAIATADDQTLAEIITPEQIALGAGDVARAISGKMIRRHPHVFGDAAARDAAAQTAAWETQKSAERAARQETGTLAGVPVGLPALTRAEKLTSRAARVTMSSNQRWEAIGPGGPPG